MQIPPDPKCERARSSTAEHRADNAEMMVQLHPGAPRGVVYLAEDGLVLRKEAGQDGLHITL